MENPQASSGHTGGGWRWRRRAWQTGILCVILTATSLLPQASADLSNETAVLLSIKKAWGNPPALNTWSAQFNPCSQWQYVQCNARNTTITSLLLTDATVNVKSPLPPSIGALINLELLSISWGLTGEIPSTIGLLTRLQGLSLSQNVLSGYIPAEIGNLTKLQSLLLNNNNLTGPLPHSLVKLQNLDYLTLSSNQLSGSLEGWIGDFPLLDTLFLYNNEFTGAFPPALGNLSSLQKLDLSSAWASSVGPLPTELGKLTSLTTLTLNQNTFGGNLPDIFSNFTALFSLDLNTCSLGGTIPSSLGNISSLEQVDLSSNSLAGPIPYQLGNAHALTILVLNQNQLSGPIPTQFGQLPNLTILDLHQNSLTGTIPPQLSELSNLKTLDLNTNLLVGEISPKLVALPDLENIYLQDNCLSGPIPTYNKSRLLGANFGQTGDSNCFNSSQVCKCGGAPAPQPHVTQVSGRDSGLSNTEHIYIGLGVGLGGLLAIVGLIFFFSWRRNQHPKIVNPNSFYRGPVRQYTVPQVREATSNFSTKVGEGAFSTVYKAVFEDGTTAAVKRFNKRRPEESFEKEVELLSSLNHRFLVNLIGYCEDLDAGEHMLLSEFMDRGNLHENLHGRDGIEPVSPLTWNERVRVIISVAYGIEYLHFGTDPPLIHRDIKSANILLSSSGDTLIAKLADFGLGKQTVVDADVMTATFGSEPPKAFPTRVAGTPGYFDPEYIHTSVLSAKVDVFSFGVVLLELITGRKPLLEERSTLANWARPYLANEDIWTILDPHLEKGSFGEEELRAVAELAHNCTENDSRKRPTMKKVLEVLTVIFSVASKMVNSSLRTSSLEFSGSNSTIGSQSRVLTFGENSMNYTQSEIIPRD